MRKLLLLTLFIIPLKSFSQSDLEKKIDSLKNERLKYQLKIDELNYQINKNESQLPKNNISEFQPTELKLRYGLPFRNSPYLLQDNLIKIIPHGETVNLLSYNNGFFKVLYNDSIGYTHYIHLEYYAKINEQIIAINEKERIDLAKRLSQKIETVEDLGKAIEKEKQDELLQSKKVIDKFLSLKSPVALKEASVTFNSIGNPEANLKIINISNNIIDAFTIDIYCYDNYNRPVNHYLYKTNIFKAISQTEILTNEIYDTLWDLHGHDNTTKIKINIKSVHFKSGKKWVPTNTSLITVKSY